MWLMRKLRPDFKTITDSRKDNRKAFRGVFRQFVLLCKGLGLVGGELVAVDGSKFKAVNSGQRNFSQKKLEERLKKIDEKVERYLDEMDRGDKEGKESEISAAELKQKIEKLKERKGRYEELLKELVASGQSQVSLTDPESRAMALTPRGEVSYNVQTAVDRKHHLIVEQDVTNEGLDNHQLFSMAQKTKQMLGQEELQVVADMGYYNHEELKRCEDEGITTSFQNRWSRRTGRGDYSAKRNLSMKRTGTVIDVRPKSDLIFVLRLRRAIKSFVITGPKLVRAVLSNPSVPPTRGFIGLSAGSMKGFWNGSNSGSKPTP